MDSDEQRTFAIVAVVAVIGVFGLLYMILGMGIYTEYECVQFFEQNMKIMPPICTNADLTKTLLEFSALVIGVLAALKVFMGKM